MFTKTESGLSHDQTVMQVILKYPETLPVWIALKAICFGCHLMKFWSLEYVTESYNIKLETLIEALENAILV